MGKGEGWGEGQGEGGCGHGSGGEEFKYGTCDCMNGDCTHCLCGYFCFPCQTYQNAERMGKSGVLHVLLACVAPCIPLLIMRGDLRDQHGIEGSTCNDFCASACCPACVSCQIANELDARVGPAN